MADTPAGGPTPAMRIANLRRIADDRTVNNFARAICGEAAAHLSALSESAPTDPANIFQCTDCGERANALFAYGRCMKCRDKAAANTQNGYLLAGAAPSVYSSDDKLSSESVPAGWKLVPVEPTDEMLEAAGEAYFTTAYRPIYQAVKAALAAAPQPNAAPQKDRSGPRLTEETAPAVAAPGRDDDKADQPKRWRVKGHGDDLITYWKSKPPHSNEYAAAEIIEELELELAEARQDALRMFRELAAEHEAHRSATGETWWRPGVKGQHHVDEGLPARGPCTWEWWGVLCTYCASECAHVPKLVSNSNYGDGAPPERTE